MTENNDKRKLLIDLLVKLMTAMKKYRGGDFIARSDIEYNDKKEINDNYFQQNKEIITKALGDNATEEDDKKLTDHLKMIGTNIFRYKFREEDENGNIREYRFSFEEDKMVVNIRNSDGEIIIQPEEFKYKDYFGIFFDDIVYSLICDNRKSDFLRKNRYNSSIANTILKYYFENVITDFYEYFIPYFYKKGFSRASDALIKTSLEIGSIELYKFCLYKSYETKENLIRSLPNVIENAIIGGNDEMIANFDSEFEIHHHMSRFLGIACTNKKMNSDVVRYFFENYGDRCSINDMIGLFKYIYDPRIAKVVLNILSNVGCNAYDINNNYYYCHDLLCFIARSGSIEVMQYMLDEISKISTIKKIDDIINKDYMERAVLNEAARYNNIDMVRFLLLRPGININVADENGETPLYMTTVGVENIEIAKLLLANDKIDINRANIYGGTPLLEAIEKGHIEIVKLLLANDKIDVNRANRCREAPLLKAVFYEDIEMVKLLLANNKINVNGANVDEEAPLLEAIEKGNIEIVKLLLANDKIDINRANRYSGITPLLKAVRNKNVEIINLLLAKEPNIDINKKEYLPNGKYSTPLEDCLRFDNFDNKNEEVFMCLLKAKAYFINKKIKNVKDKKKKIDKQILILEDMKNKYFDRKIFIKKAIEDFKAYSNYNEIEKK